VSARSGSEYIGKYRRGQKKSPPWKEGTKCFGENNSQSFKKERAKPVPLRPSPERGRFLYRPLLSPLSPDLAASEDLMFACYQPFLY